MQSATLRSSLFLHGDAVITPRVVAQEFDRAVLRIPNGWQPEAILRHTGFGTGYFPMRKQIQPVSVRLAYSSAIEKKVLRYGMEGEASSEADLIISHIADDERLSSSIRPKDIHHLSMTHLARDHFRTAVYHFQATELSPAHRNAFPAKDVANLYHKVDAAREWDLVSEVFKTTDKTPECREKIKPEDGRRTFLKCLDIIEGLDNQRKWQAGKTAMDLLRYTIADRRFREAGGITQDDIERLKQFFIKITQSTPKYSWEEDSHKATVVWRANNDLHFITACTLNPEDAFFISNLCDGYKNMLGKRRGNGGPQGWHEARCIRALESYPALKAEMHV